MASSEKIPQKLAFYLIIAFLLFYPFGQLASVSLYFFGVNIDIKMIDLVALISIPVYFLKITKESPEERIVADFLYIAIFSQIIATFILGFNKSFVGYIYLLRICAYFSFFAVSFNLLREKENYKPFLSKLLIASILFAALLGWEQYIFFPDLTSLKYIGWDDHLYRLTGAFLDPGFAGIIFSIAAIYSLDNYQNYKTSSFLYMFLFLVATVAFTYSRASYFGLGAGVVSLFYFKYKKIFQIATIVVVGIIIAYILLPRKASEGTILARTQSINARFINYSQTLQIFNESPVFGIGFNNLCQYRIKNFGGIADSNACSGSDSSLLMILGTTGVVGFIVFVSSAINLINVLRSQKNRGLIIAIGISIFVHSIFVQSLFYPWVMGLMVIIYSVTTNSRLSKS